MRTRARLAFSIAAGLLLAGCGGPETGLTPPDAAPARARTLTVIERIERDRDLRGATLRRLLASPDAVVRARASLALGRVGDRDARLALTTRLDDNEPRVRATAAVAISIARDGRFVPELLGLVRDPDARVRAAGIAALGHLRAARGFEAIVAALADRDTAVACAAADACFRLRDARVVEPLGEALRDARPRVRSHAANALATIQSTRPDPITGEAPPLERDIDAAIAVVVPALVAALSDADIDVRAAAFDALRRRSEPLDDAPAMKRALAGSAPEVAVAAARLAAVQPDGRFATLLVDALSHEHAYVRWEAAAALARLGTHLDGATRATVLRALRDRLANDREATVRGAAITALVAIDPRVIDSLDEYGTASDACVRAAYYRAAGASTHDGLGDADATVRLAALDGWAAAEDASGVTARLARVLDDPVAGVRAHAAECLAARGDAAAIPALARAADRAARNPDMPTAEARLAILAALVRLGGTTQRPRLEAALDDPSPLVRHGATVRLGALDGGRPEVDYRGVRPEPPVPGTPVGRRPEVVLQLTRGTVRLRLDRDRAPAHVEAFCALVDRGFYDGLPMHRVVPNHVVQGGDPEGTGYGSAAFTLGDEHSAAPFEAGTVGMAKLGPDTGSCQFFICLVPRPHLDQRYTVFGRVVEGMQVVGRTLPGDRIVSARRVSGSETPEEGAPKAP